MNITDLTPEQKRIKIAEACGWKSRMKHINPAFNLWLSPDGTHEVASCNLPDYLRDLNACAEFEKTMEGKQFSRYFDNLTIVIANGEPKWGAIRATATQRCDAFLLTMP